ncbi:hypothetical protein VTN02DRAFT_3864 [Thermoascus thermophilus]
MHFLSLALLTLTTLTTTLTTAVSAWKITAYEGTDCSNLLYTINGDDYNNNTAVANCTAFGSGDGDSDDDGNPLVGGVISTHTGDLWPRFYYRADCADEPGVRFDDDDGDQHPLV